MNSFVKHMCKSILGYYITGFKAQIALSILFYLM